MGWSTGPDHPRIRGEHFRPIECIAPGPGSSPHTRGAHCEKRHIFYWHGIIPAYAGSTRSAAGWLRRRPDHPRIRGEHFREVGTLIFDEGSSPHTRGARAHDVLFSTRLGIIPAYAGSTAVGVRWCCRPGDHPRIRGEHFREVGTLIFDEGSSPHTRGAPQSGCRPPCRPGIIPAYAGSTLRNAYKLTKLEDHPRIRGEHPPRTMSCPWTSGSSPHTRGAPHKRRRVELRVGIIPAYAGSTAQARRRSSDQRDHPRIRGEHSPPRGAAAIMTGSSPHTRGARAPGPRGTSTRWIIPAYAGSTEPGAPSGRHREGSSPHTRGAPAVAPAVPLRVRIIPAYAGSTTSTASTLPWRQDHPRIRGEHVIPSRNVNGVTGSSPHTRGAPVADVDPESLTRIIPAYAGST